eukprot:Nk52_evm34s2630 gene=Nk52_evmTU34s2630
MANKGTSAQNPFVPYNASFSGAPSTAPLMGTNNAGDPEAGEASNPAAKYETTLPIALNVEAAAAYSVGCISGLILLCLETKNDYVRFHAWQSTLIFTCALLLHLILVFSKFLSIVLFLADIGAIGYLGYKAYFHSETLTRFVVPVFGELAWKWVDEE